MWVCLADVIVGVVEEMITSSTVVEGLWMCRTHLLNDGQVKQINIHDMCNHNQISWLASSN